jgi:predicted PurR-regulated permease PerM
MAKNRLSPTAKRTIIIGACIGAALLVYNVRSILPPFILGAVVAYVLNPLVDMMVYMTGRSRTSMVALLYVVLIIGILVAIILIIPTLITQIAAINIDLAAVTDSIQQLVTRYEHIEIAGFSIDLLALAGEIGGTIQSVASFLVARTGGLVFGVVSGLVWIVLILLVSFYLLKDSPRIHRTIHDTLPPAYQGDFVHLADEINEVLSNYLRGQLALAVVVGIMTGVALAIIGVRNALLLGVLAGMLEIVPSVGPIIASLPAIAIAFFQGSTHMALPNHLFALLVIGVYTIIQQIENNFLVPRIIGSSVNLHPIIVIFGALAGASLAGILGVLLAVPVIAIGRILGVYLYQLVKE